MRRKLFGSGSPDWYDLGNLESGTRRVIDNQDEVERLLRELTKALPLSALATPALMANLRDQSSTANITLDCNTSGKNLCGSWFLAMMKPTTAQPTSKIDGT
jgi:hypothetical protein